MAVVVACVLALGVTSTVLIWASRKGAVMSGFAVLVGMVAGTLALWALGGGTTLIMIAVPAALLLGLADAVLTARGVHWFWRLIVQGVVIFGVLVLEWRRGDLFASGAVMATVTGVLMYNVINFAIGAGQRSGARRLPVGLWLLGAVYLVPIAVGLPNPGLRTLVLVVIAGVLPLLIWPAPTGFLDRALGPVLAGLGCALAFYAWLGNASPAMVAAPLLVVAVDVVYTLVARVVTAEGRAGLAGERTVASSAGTDGSLAADTSAASSGSGGSAAAFGSGGSAGWVDSGGASAPFDSGDSAAPFGSGRPATPGAAASVAPGVKVNWWRRIDAWASPSDDLVWQRAWAESPLHAGVWLAGATVVVLCFSLLTWWIGVPWVVALAVLVVPALGWLALQERTFSASRQSLLVALAVVSAVTLLAALAAWRLDGRLLVMALPLLGAALVWGAALVTRRTLLLPARASA